MGGSISVCSEYGKGSAFSAVIPQKARSREPLARVDEREAKHVLIYERREAFIRSIIQTMDNLGVGYKLATGVSEFSNKLRSDDFTHIFVSSVLYDTVRHICAECPSKPVVALIAEFGDSVAEKDVSLLVTPVYSISVANILNGLTVNALGSASKRFAAGFTAPEARVLVVDDIQTNLRVAEGLLNPYMMNVDSCSSGPEAIEAVKRKQYDLILMDHMMPVMNGIETTAAIRALGDVHTYCKNVPIIAVTANVILGIREMILEKGFDDFLSKPIDMFKLNALLEKWIPSEKKGEPLPEPPDPADDADELYLPGVDIKYGISMTGGKLASYLSTLAVFNDDARAKITELDDCVRSVKLSLYTIHIHALKSALGSIGASDLSESAAVLESAGINGDFDEILRQNGDFIFDLETLLNHINAALQKRKRCDGGGKDRSVMEAALLKMKTALTSLDISAMNETAELLKEYARDNELGGHIGKLLKFMLIGAYDECEALIEEIIAMP
jgi:CheY-like chemotaxis protein